MAENVSVALQNGFLFGIILSVYFTAGLVLIGRVNPVILLNDYPPDIQRRYRELRGEAEVETIRRRGAGLRLPFILGVLGILVMSVVRLQALVGPPTYSLTAFSLFATVMTFNLYDLLVLDWFWFVNFTPKFAVLTGTEGMAGYRNYRWHFRGFVIGCLLSVIVAIVGAGYVELAQLLAARG
jgi:hypothetical protein